MYALHIELYQIPHCEILTSLSCLWFSLNKENALFQLIIMTQHYDSPACLDQMYSEI